MLSSIQSSVSPNNSTNNGSSSSSTGHGVPATAEVDSIFEAVMAIEAGEELRDTWTGEMRLWIEMILTRMERR